MENNRDETQNNLIALASGNSQDALYFKGPRERWIRFQLPDGGFLPEKPHFTHGDTAVCFRISDRNIASKLCFGVFVTKANSKAKHELHPDNIVHSARLDFTLHIYGQRRPRCIQDFTFGTHFPIKQRGKADKTTEVEYEDPCYIDIEFKTTGGVSHGLLDPCVARFDDKCRRLFTHLYQPTHQSSDKHRTVKIRVDVGVEHVHGTEGLTSALQELANNLPQSHSYDPYRSRGKDIRITYGQQKPRALVHQDWGMSTPILSKWRMELFLNGDDRTSR